MKISRAEVFVLVFELILIGTLIHGFSHIYGGLISGIGIGILFVLSDEVEK